MALRESGKGKRRRKADGLNNDEEETMWQSGVLGHSTPKSLNHTMLYQISPEQGVASSTIRLESRTLEMQPQERL